MDEEVDCLQLVQDDSNTVSETADRISGQGFNVLAALASLGVSEKVRLTVQDALQQLDQATLTAHQECTTLGVTPASQPNNTSELQQPDVKQAAKSLHDGSNSSKSNRSRIPKPRAGSTPADTKKAAELEQKLAMSRSIMRKLYHRNVELEKEVQVIKAANTPLVFTVKTEDLLQKRHSAVKDGHGSLSTSMLRTEDLVAKALQERDATVVRLQQALDAAHRRCSLLETQLTRTNTSNIADTDNVKLSDALVQSQLHYARYKQVRDDYHRLLEKRTSTVQSNKAASVTAKTMVSEMQVRLQHEVHEREAEAALYSAKLYESEQKMSDWYVERRLLEEHIARLNAEIAQRDKLDGEMETCVISLLDRLRHLEAVNGELESQLKGKEESTTVHGV